MISIPQLAVMPATQVGEMNLRLVEKNPKVVEMDAKVVEKGAQVGENLAQVVERISFVFDSKKRLQISPDALTSWQNSA